MPKNVLIIGDTIVNKTYKASALDNREFKYPHSFLNEEILYLDAEPIYSIQGVGYIAKYLSKQGITAHVWTSIGAGPDSNFLENQLKTFCGDQSLYQIDDKPTAYTVRVLRDIRGSKLNEDEQDYRPQLRIDRIEPTNGNINIPYERISEILGKGDICVVRVLQPDFLGKLGDIENVLEKIQDNVKKCGAHLV